ncbi:MAG: YggS family pyridoxal phosphate-dependent enzyme [Saprospiraceae bacterium]|nr:YggS family pyridoxal phosphate-dependent enzyme [Saprospiraceae bacterium]
MKLKELLKITDPYQAKVIAVTKNQPIENIQELINDGQKILAENRPQELIRKSQIINQTLEWHLIGHLQTNKIKLILPYTELIHSVDSSSLMIKINSEAERINKIQKILIQIKLSEEEKKQGYPFELFEAQLSELQLQKLRNINIIGVMGMGSLTDVIATTRKEFRELYNRFYYLKKNYFQNNEFKEISMGMSSDYQIALEEGATMIRIGSLLFE